LASITIREYKVLGISSRYSFLTCDISLSSLLWAARHGYYGNARPLQRVCIQQDDTLRETRMQNLVSNWVKAFKYFWAKQSYGFLCFTEILWRTFPCLLIINILILVTSITEAYLYALFNESQIVTSVNRV